MATIHFEYERDIYDLVLVALPRDAQDEFSIRAMRPAKLLARYFNWRSRFVPAHPRAVHESAALQINPLRTAPQYRAAIDAIINKITCGHDLTPHLSERVTTGYIPDRKPTFSNRRDLDLLLNDWGVHHLHLSTTIEPNGFVTRTGPLLLAAFDPHDAYLIDILPAHGGWESEHVAHILIDEWPTSSFVHFVGAEPAITSATVVDQDRKLLRNNGINSGWIHRHGKLYAIGHGGMTSAGTAVASTQRANLLIRGLRMFRRGVILDPLYVEDAIQRRSGTVKNDLYLHMRFIGDVPVIREEPSGVLFPVPGLVASTDIEHRFGETLFPMRIA